MTTQERNKVYREALERIEKDPFGGFACCAIKDITGIKTWDLDEYFPELFLFREYNNSAWLSNGEGFYCSQKYFKTIRLVVLEFCIAMTE